VHPVGFIIKKKHPVLNEVKSIRPSRTRHETKVERKTDAQEFWSGNVQEEDYWRDVVEAEVQH
jgi:hypothetical protein